MVIQCQVTVNVHSKVFDTEVAVRSGLPVLRVGEDYNLLFV